MKKQLLLLSLCTFSIAAQAQIADCSELFISEYVTGSGNNRALELYNPTSEAINLAGYKVGRFRNGAGNPMTLNLSGTVLPNDVFVIVMDKRVAGTGTETPIDAELEAMADTFVNPNYIESNSPFYFNGDDAVPLIKGADDLLDLVGKIGEDPGTAWSDANGTWWTIDKTLVRKAGVKKGVSVNPAEFIPEAEWDSLPNNTFTSLGWHDCSCANVGVAEAQSSKINMYPNPSADKQLLISSNKIISTIKVFNVLGQEAEKAELKDEMTTTHRFNLQHLTTGLYIVRVELMDGSTISNKVILGK